MNEMEEIELTPLEAALVRANQFGDSMTQASVWVAAAEKLKELENATSPEDLQQKFIVENFITEIVRTIPDAIVGDA